MSTAVAAIRARQTWRNRSTRVLVKVISFLERQDEVIVDIPNVGVRKIYGAEFRDWYNRVPEVRKTTKQPPPKKTEVVPTVTKPKARRGAPEKALVVSILARLEMMPGVEAWRNNTGAFKAEATKTTRRKFVRFGAPGSGDVFVVISPHGRFLSVEAKAPNGRERETQKRWRQKMHRVGASSIVVRSVDEVVAAIVAIRNET